MKLASIKDGPDGRLAVVSRDLTHYACVEDVAETMQDALLNWEEAAPTLQLLYIAINAGEIAGHPFDENRVHSPLPRAQRWVDGAARFNRFEQALALRGEETLTCLHDAPVFLQDGPIDFSGPHEPVHGHNERTCVHAAARIAAITDAVPYGTQRSHAAQHIKLLMLCADFADADQAVDDVTGVCGRYQTGAFSPVAVTPDELEGRWRGDYLSSPVCLQHNGAPVSGSSTRDAASMTFDSQCFSEIISDEAHVRKCPAGTIFTAAMAPVFNQGATEPNKVSTRVVPSGNQQGSLPRMEVPALTDGENIKIQVFDTLGKSIFGSIQKYVIAA